MNRRGFLQSLLGIPAAVLVSKLPFIPEALPYEVMPYKGATALDVGCFYCPYVPLQIYNTTEHSPPQTTFKTRYGIITRPSLEFTE